MDALVRNDPNTFHLLDYEHGMRPIGAQICGSKVSLAGKAAKMIEELGFDVVDLNCGCPVDKVTKDGSGSGLLRSTGLIGDLLAEMVAAVKIPVTVKIRVGWSDGEIVGEQITQIAEQAGAQAIAVHGRTRQQGYKGPANWDYIKECVEAAKHIKVMGNGDVFSPQAASAMMEHTGCDGVLVSRGTLGNPWIAEDIGRYWLEGVLDRHVSLEVKLALEEHFCEMLRYHSDWKVVVEMRKVGCWYLGKGAAPGGFRRAISRAGSVEEILNLIRTVPVQEEERV